VLNVELVISTNNYNTITYTITNTISHESRTKYLLTFYYHYDL